MDKVQELLGQIGLPDGAVAAPSWAERIDFMEKD
jgi:hypothetical protein